MTTTVGVLDRLLTSRDRASAVRELPEADVNSTVHRLLDRGATLGYIDSREVLLLLVQRFDFGLLDLQLADQYRKAPISVEAGLEASVTARARGILNDEPSTALVKMLVRRTKVAARRLANVGTSRDDSVILEEAAGTNGELRCAYCGYHFQENDVRLRLREAVRLDSIRFASALQPGRMSDVWKPVRTKTNKGEFQVWTALEIEHRVPEAALGDNTRENLTVACKWCNSGKSAYQSFAEALPSLLAVSLGKLHAPWATRLVARAFYSIVNRERECNLCHATAANAELTVEVATSLEGLRRPFEARPVCYDCKMTAKGA